VDEEAIKTGMGTMAWLALSFLTGKKSPSSSSI
jgi:hypothetical protein